MTQGQAHSPRTGSSGEFNSAHAFQRVAVIGAGAWGTALAISAARAGRQVRLWTRHAEFAASLNHERCNSRYLPNAQLPAAISACSSYQDALQDAQLILLVVPSQFIRSTCEAIAALKLGAVPVLICAKGIEHGSGLLLTEVVAQTLPGHPCAVLSGPSFADEVAADMPTAVSVASDDAGLSGDSSLAARIALTLGTRAFRPYVSDDMVGVAVGGAVKNVLAIASGIASGLGLGANTRALLITRGLEEVKRLTLALGGHASTVTGLAGLGDLSLTCSSEQSRNMRYGMSLASGQRDTGPRTELVEGAENVVAVTDLARKHGVEMPICAAVRAIIVDGARIDAQMDALLSRPLKAESDAIAWRQPQVTAAPKPQPLRQTAVLLVGSMA